MINNFEGNKFVIQEQGHGRTETRLCLVEHDNPAETMQVKHYISSAKLCAKELLAGTRAHWSIENQMHWRLDVGFNDDSCSIRREQAGENLAVARHIALNLLTAEKNFKAGLERKLRKANRSSSYLC